MPIKNKLEIGTTPINVNAEGNDNLTFERSNRFLLYLLQKFTCNLMDKIIL